MVHPLRNFLNKLRWESKETPRRYLITYRHRGAPDNVKSILASEIQKLGKSYFMLSSETGEEVTIPFHRVLEILDTPHNTVIWKSRKNPEDSKP